MPNPTVPADVLKLAQELADPKPMRRGSLTERYVKCNKTGCACDDSEDDRHGPYYSVSRVVEGRTKSRWLNGGHVDTVQRQIEEGQRFRKNVEAYWQACERWAEAELETPEAASRGAAEKKGSKQQFKLRSARKSKGL
jgi:uncharacterized protein DUF6788